MDSSIVSNLTYYRNTSVSECETVGPFCSIHYDLTFVLDGSLTYFVDKKKYIVKKNDAILIRPGMHLHRPSEDTSVSYVSFNFTVFDEKVLPDGIHFENIVSPFVKNMVTSFPHDRKTPLFYSKEKLINMLNVILFEIIDKVSTQNYNPYVREIISYINIYINQPLSLKDISRHIHLSNVYTSQLFKSETGTTLTDFINECKMKIAKDRILSDEASLKEIAESIGYQDYCYFSRVFKKSFGYSPYEYRKKIRNVNK